MSSIGVFFIVEIPTILPLKILPLVWLIARSLLQVFACKRMGRILVPPHKHLMLTCPATIYVSFSFLDFCLFKLRLWIDICFGTAVWSPSIISCTLSYNWKALDRVLIKSCKNQDPSPPLGQRTKAVNRSNRYEQTTVSVLVYYFTCYRMPFGLAQ